MEVLKNFADLKQIKENDFKKIDDTFKSVVKKYKSTLSYIRANEDKKREYLFKAELLPLLSQDEIDFIGFWRGETTGTDRIDEYGLQKRVYAHTFKKDETFYKDLSKAARGAYRS